MNRQMIFRSMALVTLLALAGGCTTLKRVDMEPSTLRNELRAGGVIQEGDHVTVVSEVQGDRTFVVTDVDGEAIRGQADEVPINEVLIVEQRKFAPIRTGGALWTGSILVTVTLGALYLFLGVLL